LLHANSRSYNRKKKNYFWLTKKQKKKLKPISRNNRKTNLIQIHWKLPVYKLVCVNRQFNRPELILSLVSLTKRHLKRNLLFHQVHQLIEQSTELIRASLNFHCSNRLRGWGQINPLLLLCREDDSVILRMYIKFKYSNIKIFCVLFLHFGSPRFPAIRKLCLLMLFRWCCAHGRCLQLLFL